MKVSVIGTGAIGGTIAKKLAKAGYKVAIANSRGYHQSKNLQKKSGLNPVISN